MYYTMNQFTIDVDKLIDQIKNSDSLTSQLTVYKGVFGVTRSGQLLAQAIAFKLGTFLYSERQYNESTEKSKILVVDATTFNRDQYPDSDFACTHRKLNAENMYPINYMIHSITIDDIQYWWDEEKVEKEQLVINNAIFPELDKLEDDDALAEQDGIDNSQRIQILSRATTCMLELDQMIKELS